MPPIKVYKDTRHRYGKFIPVLFPFISRILKASGSPSIMRNTDKTPQIPTNEGDKPLLHSSVGGVGRHVYYLAPSSIPDNH